MAKSRTLEQLRRELTNQMRQRTGWEKLSESVNGVARLVSAIIETSDDPDAGDWVEHVEGLTGEEKQSLKGMLDPYVPAIRQFALSDRTQKGGADTPPAPSANKTATTATTAATATTTATNASNPSVSTLMPAMPAIDLDGAFMGLVERTNQLDQTAEYLASQYGLTRLERDFDTSDDFHIVPEFLRVMIGTLGQGGMALKTVLDKLKVPYRLIVFAIYLYLDISRLTAATMGYPAQQKTATIILALLELFRGDWKKAVLTFMGFYGTTPLLAGQLGKVFLYLFERLSPTIQDRMVYGAWDASKSLVVGLLLSLFQLTAPLSVRKPVMDVLETLSQGKKALDQSLVEAGLEPRSDEFEPTWANINRLQAVNRDPAFICSCEYQEVIKNIGDSALIKLILQLLGLPVNEEMKEKYTCVGRIPCRPYLEALKEEQAPSAPAPPASLGPSAPPAPPAPLGPTGAPPASLGPTGAPPASPAPPASLGPTGAPPAPPASLGPTGAPPPPPYTTTATPSPSPYTNTSAPPPTPPPATMMYPPQAMFTQPQAMFPQPQAMFPQPQAVFPQPQTMFPQPQAVFPQPQTMFTQPQTMFTQPQAMSPPQPPPYTAQGGGRSLSVRKGKMFSRKRSLRRRAHE